MSAFYAIAGTSGTPAFWSVISTWSLTSGGAAGSAIPGAGDDVYLGNFYVTVDGGMLVSGTYTIAVNSINFSGTGQLQIPSTSLNDTNAHAVANAHATTITATNGWNVTTGASNASGLVLFNFNGSGGPVYTLSGPWSVASGISSTIISSPNGYKGTNYIVGNVTHAGSGTFLSGQNSAPWQFGSSDSPVTVTKNGTGSIFSSNSNTGRMYGTVITGAGSTSGAVFILNNGGAANTAIIYGFITDGGLGNSNGPTTVFGGNCSITDLSPVQKLNGTYAVTSAIALVSDNWTLDLTGATFNVGTGGSLSIKKGRFSVLGTPTINRTAGGGTAAIYCDAAGISVPAPVSGGAYPFVG